MPHRLDRTRGPARALAARPQQVVPVSRLRPSPVSAGVDGALDAGWPMLGAQQTLGSLFLLSRYALLPA